MTSVKSALTLMLSKDTVCMTSLNKYIFIFYVFIYLYTNYMIYYNTGHTRTYYVGCVSPRGGASEI